MMGITIKELDANTVEFINQCDNTFTVDARLDVHAESGEIRYTLVSVPPYQKRYAHDVIDYHTYLDSLDKTAFLAFVDGSMAGQIILRRNWNNYAYVEDIVVDARFRRLGIGRRLMARAVEWARHRQLPGIMLETQNNNVGACKLYEQLGFKLAGFDSCLYRGIDRDTDEVALYWYLLF